MWFQSRSRVAFGFRLGSVSSVRPLPSYFNLVLEWLLVSGNQLNFTTYTITNFNLVLEWLLVSGRRHQNRTLNLNSIFQSRSRVAFGFRHTTSLRQLIYLNFFRFNLVLEWLLVSGCEFRYAGECIFSFNLVLEWLLVSG